MSTPVPDPRKRPGNVACESRGVKPKGSPSHPGEPGEGKAGSHTHPAVTHSHDHYHVSHHHRGGPLAEFEHRAYWHTHEHNHAELTHSHDYDLDEEDQQHPKEAHVHDHTAPTLSPA